MTMLDLVGRMVCYCYLMDYPDVKAQDILVEASYISRAHANAQVYALAEKYNIEGLKVLARTKFDAAMVAEFDPVSSSQPVADLSGSML